MPVCWVSWAEVGRGFIVPELYLLIVSKAHICWPWPSMPSFYTVCSSSFSCCFAFSNTVLCVARPQQSAHPTCFLSPPSSTLHIHIHILYHVLLAVPPLPSLLPTPPFSFRPTLMLHRSLMLMGASWKHLDSQLWKTAGPRTNFRNHGKDWKTLESIGNSFETHFAFCS